MKFRQDIRIEANFFALMRERGKLVPGSHRVGHNVFTITGRNWLSKLMAWKTIGPIDGPYTNRRARWMGLGIGTSLEVPTVSRLVQPVIATGSEYLVPIQSSEFTSTSVLLIREFGLSEVTFTNTPIPITEAGLFTDVNPAAGAPTEDIEVGGSVHTTLDPAVETNPPVAYKAFDALTKTVDFTLEIRWELRIT